jgi:nucleoside-diphosphate-sugar epimerase
MRVLVTGHRGSIGTVPCDVVARAGHDVLGVDVGWFADSVFGPRLGTRDAEGAPR